MRRRSRCYGEAVVSSELAYNEAIAYEGVYGMIRLMKSKGVLRIFGLESVVEILHPHIPCVIHT